MDAYTTESSRSQLYIDLNRARGPVHDAIMAMPVKHLSKIDRLAVVPAPPFFQTNNVYLE